LSWTEGAEVRDEWARRCHSRAARRHRERRTARVRRSRCHLCIVCHANFHPIFAHALRRRFWRFTFAGSSWVGPSLGRWERRRGVNLRGHSASARHGFVEISCSSRSAQQSRPTDPVSRGVCLESSFQTITIPVLFPPRLSAIHFRRWAFVSKERKQFRPPDRRSQSTPTWWLSCFIRFVNRRRVRSRARDCGRARAR